MSWKGEAPQDFDLAFYWMALTSIYIDVAVLRPGTIGASLLALGSVGACHGTAARHRSLHGGRSVRDVSSCGHNHNTDQWMAAAASSCSVRSIMVPLFLLSAL
jgi:hypothetical protein